MIDTQRLRKIKSLQDIKLEKAKLRYEALLSETKLYEDMNAIQNQFTFPVFLARVKGGVSFVNKLFSGIQNTIGWVFRKKDQSDQTEAEE